MGIVGCGGQDEPNAHRVDRERPAVEPASDDRPSEPRNAPLPHEQERKTSVRPARPDDWFETVTARSGVDFAYRDGNETGHYALIETVGGGAALFDFDRDGDLDLFLTGGGRLTGRPVEVTGLPSTLYRNDGNWTFTDVTATTGLGEAGPYTHGCAVGDYDNDGYPDLFVAGYGGCRLYHNIEGERFDDVTQAAGLSLEDWSVSAVWADYNNDGRLDLYVVTYCRWQPDHTRRCHNPVNGLRDICGPSHFRGEKDRLFRNRGDGTFEDVTEQAGLENWGRGFEAVAADFDDDGWIDIYVVNDVQENHLYRGSSRLPLANEGVSSGVACSPRGEIQGSMGVDFGDFDGDGRADLWYTNFSNEDNTLYRNVPEGGFVDATNSSGLAGRSRRWVGFGTAMADFDNDGWLDLAVANGHVAYSREQSPYYQPAQLFKNVDGRRYEEVSHRGGPYFSRPHAGRGLAVGDLDNDGALDLVIVHQNDPVVLLRNRHSAGRWVRVRLQGTQSNRDAVGAEVTAEYGGRTLIRWVRGGGGYLSHFDRRILFPAGEAATPDVTVKWPAGSRERFDDLAPGRTHVLVEGKGKRP